MVGDSNGTDSFDPTQYEFDPRPSDQAPAPLGFTTEITPTRERIAVIRTTDRITYRRCRRRWGWSSHLRGNLGSREGQSPLWMGSGFHFALEDFHGANHFGHPTKAFDEYVLATRRHDERGLPPSWQEDWELANGMLAYYADYWLKTRPALKTFVYNGIPQVEVNFRVEVPFDKRLLQEWGYDKCIYSGTIDRVIIDEHGQLWIVEYKTAKAIQTLHLANDSQVSSYCWAGQYLYGRPIVGVIYQQHRKDLPKQPKILANGRLSTDKKQLVTYASVKQQVINLYGSVQAAPGEYVDLLNYLINEETPYKDKFITRSYIQRNEHQCQAEGVKILMEAEEMLNPNTPLYPNPDRTCQFMCPFNGPCVSLDDGSDWDYELSLLMKPRDPVYDSWRKKVRLPADTTNTFLTITHQQGENNG